MKRSLSLKLGVLAAVAAMFSAGAAARDLTVVSWGGAYQDAQREVYFKPFMATGVKMVEESWDGGVGTLRTKVKGGNNNWDVVQVESEELLLGCEEGLFDKLDWTKLGGKDKYLPDAVNDCGVGAIVYSFVLAYDGDKIKSDPPKNWADFWDVEKFPGRRALGSIPQETMEIALLADGVDPANVYTELATPEGADRAFKALDKIKGDIFWWDNAQEPITWLLEKKVGMAAGYSGRIFRAAVGDRQRLGMVWDGQIYENEMYAIPKGAPNKEEALQFIAFATSTEGLQAQATQISYGPARKSANATEILFKDGKPVAHKLGAAPNILVVLFDDAGFSDFGCYGSPIATPAIDAVAGKGLRYTGFHTTAMCSTTRAALLTGRNHHSVGVGCLANFDSGYPGYRGKIAREAGTIAEMLRPHGYRNYMLGKWHVTPLTESGATGPFDGWPLGRGFDRYYGFMDAETDQYAPELVRDNTPVDPIFKFDRTTGAVLANFGAAAIAAMAGSRTPVVEPLRTPSKSTSACTSLLPLASTLNGTSILIVVPTWLTICLCSPSRSLEMRPFR